jgi:threonylcarbamoyladenosine tRNA methylthiotransferase MtaB
LFESENKEGYIHGFTENYVKVKAPWNPELVNTLHEINLKIDDDGSANRICYGSSLGFKH